ncbi:HD domain-containing phosphohydrolase [Thermosyntropha sp.]|uniref:HD-GYP domain-containing protein n=1 Tax=Thermosyntropha sp. TaxID=2740820 RepID=UPI0025F17E44|nr:HD domain-containing phosphohydrolase [Thermosyntropha sp.]MBO8158150.1 HD domain-containing protein [Thermosyntropha sp.]
MEVKRDNINIEYNLSEYINLEINKKCQFADVLNLRKSIEKHKDDDKNMLLKNVVHEIYIPVEQNGRVLGYVYLGNFAEEINDFDIKRLNQIIENNIYEILRLEQMKISYKITIENTIFFHEVFKNRSSFMVNHIYNVASWAVQIAKRLNYSDEDLTRIYLAALLHDIGKIFIDEDILNKPGKLTEQEYEEIKKHVRIGQYLARYMFLFDRDSHIDEWILQHHEKWDGTGYPRQLKGELILKEPEF